MKLNHQNKGLSFFTVALVTCFHCGWNQGSVVHATCEHGNCNHGKSTTLRFQQLPELHEQSVHMKDPETVERKLKEIMQDGKDQLQVVADFDRTLSKFSYKGQLVATCHNVLEHSRFLPESYKNQAIEIKNTYYPIETDPHRTIQEKYPYMVEWWTKVHDLLIKYNLTKSALIQAVQEANIILRDGSEAMFYQLYKQKVPLLIFSAGLGDVIEVVLDMKIKKIYENIKIVSNYMDFNHQGVLVGFRGDLIHTFNKNENAIHDSDYFKNLKDRHNVLLLGDSIGDPHMTDGIEDLKNILKIGFLNDKIDASLEKYKEKYDIVLVQDETMDVANAILRKIL